MAANRLDDVRHDPRMLRLMDAIRCDAEETAQVRLRRHADALAGYAREIGVGRLEPASPAGRLLTGAALVLHGHLCMGRPGEAVDGGRVLLIEGVTTSWIEVDRYASRLRRAGARTVHAFAVRADGSPTVPLDGWRVSVGGPATDAGDAVATGG